MSCLEASRVPQLKITQDRETKGEVQANKLTN